MHTPPSATNAHLRFMAGWGTTNWFTVCGWLAAGVLDRTAPGSTCVVHTQRDGSPLQSLLRGDVEVTLATPVAAAAMAHKGRGMFSEPNPSLRAIGALPHRDRLVLAIDEQIAERYGLVTMSDLADEQPAIRLAVGRNEVTNPVGFAVRAALAEHGVEWDDVASWGGELIECGRPHEAIEHVEAGRADGLFFEAIMLWHDLAEARRLRFLPVDAEAAERLEDAYDLLPAELAPGEFRGIDAVLQTVDFSDWIVLVRDDLEAEVAAALAQTIVEDRSTLEQRFRHLPLERSPLSYPIEPDMVVRTGPVPLHDGALNYFESIGCDPAASEPRAR